MTFAFQAITTLSGTACALPLPHVDTDQIMPKQFLKGIDRQGLARGFLHDMRFDASGQARSDFVLNQAPWTEAKFLITGANFGCGSSREHAVWGMRELGIRCVLGTSFGGIFSDNCLRNGVPALVLPAAEVTRLMALAQDPQRCQMALDLAAQTLHTPADDQTLHFDIDPLHQEMLLRGLDAVGMSLIHAADIQSFEARYLQANPWVMPPQKKPTQKNPPKEN
jgi:3-isopropylmalate/(R)-2-methylmalate dehydratase small subunit